jgi:hypothetical protein
MAAFFAGAQIFRCIIMAEMRLEIIFNIFQFEIDFMQLVVAFITEPQ